MENTENTSQAMHLLAEAHRAWERMRPLREKRERNKNYTYGNQWCDMMTDEHGRRVSELAASARQRQRSADQQPYPPAGQERGGAVPQPSRRRTRTCGAFARQPCGRARQPSDGRISHLRVLLPAH